MHWKYKEVSLHRLNTGFWTTNELFSFEVQTFKSVHGISMALNDFIAS